MWDNKAVRCKICDMSFTTIQEFFDHVETVHNVAVPQDRSDFRLEKTDPEQTDDLERIRDLMKKHNLVVVWKKPDNPVFDSISWIGHPEPSQQYLRLIEDAILTASNF
jgi:hypothetical protein